MEKFTKTTEIDISGMHDVIEEETPKTNKFGKIISLILSLLLAIGIWLYVMETDQTIVSDIYVVQTGDSQVVTVEAKGTHSALADLDKEDIVITTVAGKYVFETVPGITFEVVEDK